MLIKAQTHYTDYIQTCTTILFGHKMYYIVNESYNHYAKREKPVKHVTDYNDSIYMKCPEQANL